MDQLKTTFACNASTNLHPRLWKQIACEDVILIVVELASQKSFFLFQISEKLIINSKL